MTLATYQLRDREQVAQRYDSLRDNDMFGFLAEVLVPYMTYDDAKPYLKPEVTAADWDPYPLHVEAVFKQAVDYLEFAWGKALDHRGISAGRSVQKLDAWCWLLGADPGLIDDAPYAPYGAPALAVAAKFLGQAIPDDDETQRMAAGDSCSPRCSECAR